MSVLVVEDMLLVREAIVRAVDADPFDVVATATTGGEGVALARAHRPALALIDQGLPDRSGIDVVRELRALLPATLAVVITASPDPDLAVVSMQVGAVGYLPKTMGAEALHRALRGVLDGELAMPRALARTTMARLASRSGRAGDPLAGLTAREREILVLLRQGSDTQDLARRFGVSMRTVATEVRAILVKMGVRTRAEAIAALSATRDGHP